MIVATTNDLAGHRVVRQLGVVRGITVRSRNVISDAIGGVQSMIGGAGDGRQRHPGHALRRQ